MDDPEAQERLEKYVSSLSKGEAARGLSIAKLHKGFLLCDFIVHHGVSDENGKWHGGAMVTVMDVIGGWTASTFTSQEHVSVYLSLSFYSKPNLQEMVEIEGKVTGQKGRMTSVRVEVRNKVRGGQMVASADMWVAPSPAKKKGVHQTNKKPLSSKL
ncbi:uncharacterized protein LOC114752002 [Neltuma alba]|uniref:uncharacterized protein LOC114752002 n=1 Tax=Neltuma alba TaxID=207710 RepID=UPI0010A2F112|nr:uncharacterized protein LOC114752002 [Prosopis alba]